MVPKMQRWHKRGCMPPGVYVLRDTSREPRVAVSLTTTPRAVGYAPYRSHLLKRLDALRSYLGTTVVYHRKRANVRKTQPQLTFCLCSLSACFGAPGPLITSVTTCFFSAVRCALLPSSGESASEESWVEKKWVESRLWDGVGRRPNCV